MFSSSLFTDNGEEFYKSTTSGLLVTDSDGTAFVTVAAHGFESDNLVYHPDPLSGIVIGTVVKTIPEIDVSLVRLNGGLRYTNETFGSNENPDGIRIEGFSRCEPPDW